MTVSEVAWYGAIVATLTFVFNVWKWSRERARLQISIKPTWYPDGGIESTERTPDGGTRQVLKTYYHIEVINIGERPTTVMGVQATTKAIRPWEWISRSRGEMGIAGQAFTAHYGKALPHELGPGQVWSCRVPQRQIDQLNRNGRPKLEIVATCLAKPLYRRFPKPSLAVDRDA